MIARLAVGVVAVVSSACNQNTVPTPTRSLDRPSDIALVCVVRGSDSNATTTLAPLSTCIDANQQFCDTPDPTTGNVISGGDRTTDGKVSQAMCPTTVTNQVPDINNHQLFLFASGTGRGEVALATAGPTSLGKFQRDTNKNYVLDSKSSPLRVFQRSGPTIIDLDPSIPGYSFLPVGASPDHIRASKDGCVAVTANSDSCDLAVIDTLAVIRTQTGEAAAGSLPSDLVRRVQPHSRDGRPILSRPSWIEFAPSHTAMDPSCGGALAANNHHAFVAYPACNLIAEVDLASGVLLQAFRLTASGTASVDVGSLRCPSECAAGVTGTPYDFSMVADAAIPKPPPPASDASTPMDALVPTDAMNNADLAFLRDASPGDQGRSGAAGDGPARADAGAPADAAMLDAAAALDGGTGYDLSLPSILPQTQPYPRSFAVDDSPLMGGACPGKGGARLYVADAVGDHLTRVDLDCAGSFATSAVIPLQAPGGVELVRLSDRIIDTSITADPGARYLYAAARDRTLRVVDVDHEMECETNPDGSVINRRYHWDGALQAFVGPDGKALGSDSDPGGTLAVQRALRCLPIDPANNPRDPLALSPGISLSGGALPRDVGFTNLTPQTPNFLPLPTTTGSPPSGGPGLMLGFFAWAVDSAGHTTAINLLDRCPQPNLPAQGPNPQQACDPHAFPPSVSFVMTGVDASGRRVPLPNPPVPLALDLMPNRPRNANARFATVQPTDAAGATRLTDFPLGSPINQNGEVSTLCNVSNLPEVPDAGINEGAGAVNCQSRMPFYCRPNSTSSSGIQGGAGQANLIHFRDADAPRGESWTFSWEGRVAGTGGIGGSVAGITRADGTRAAQLADATGEFCSHDVSPGDKVYFTGCGANSDCGANQICFLDPAAPTEAHGICLRSKNLEAARAGACAQWTVALRRYRVIQSAATTLTLDELPEPEQTVDELGIGRSDPTQPGCNTDADCVNVNVLSPSTPPVVLRTSCLPTGDVNGHPVNRCIRACPLAGAGLQCGVGYLCSPSRFGGNRCLRAPLPPPPGALHDLCFGDVRAGERQTYEIHAGESFTVRGDASGTFLSGFIDPASGSDRSCALPSNSDPIGRLLHSRVPLLAPPCDARLNQCWLAPLDASDNLPNTCRLSASDPQHIYLRFSNPDFDVVVVVPQSLLYIDPGVDAAVPPGGDLGVPMGSNIVVTRAPLDDTTFTFGVAGGFRPYSFVLGSDITAQLPRSAQAGPDLKSLYVVDEGKQNVGSGLRGQVIRFLADTQITDSSFLIR